MKRIPKIIKGSNIQQVMQEALERAKNAPPQTPEQLAETAEILKQLPGLSIFTLTTKEK